MSFQLVALIGALVIVGNACAADGSYASVGWYADKLLSLVSTLGASFVGAYFAFKLQRRRDKDDRQDRDITAANIAIFTLALQANKLHNLKTQFVEPYKGTPLAFLQMPPTTGVDTELLSVDASSLSFLLQTPNPNLLGEVAIASGLYLGVIDAFKQRSRLHLEEFQPKAEEVGLVSGNDYALEEIRERLGDRLWTSLQLATAACVEMIDPAIRDVEAAGAGLRSATLAAFPKAPLKVIGFALPKEQNAQDPAATRSWWSHD